MLELDSEGLTERDKDRAEQRKMRAMKRIDTDWYRTINSYTNIQSNFNWSSPTKLNVPGMHPDHNLEKVGHCDD